jgi:hypothetical protein
MAAGNPESLSDPFPLTESHALVPDSSPLRVSENTQLESGIPKVRKPTHSENAAVFGFELTLESGAQRIELVLANVVRTDASLSSLARGLKHLSASAQAARDANAELMQDLDELRTHLTRSHEEEQALRYRMSQLEQLLSVVRHEAANERAFLIEQQDLFLVEILTDHERQIGELRDRLREGGQRQLDSQRLDELTAQRDQAREYATRCERERDLAWQELAAGTPPAERLQPGPSGPTPIAAISLRSISTTAASSNAAPDTVRSSERIPTNYSLEREDISE